MRNIPRGLRKHIRREKARIRREFLDKREQSEQIAQLYKNFGFNSGGIRGNNADNIILAMQKSQRAQVSVY